MWAVGSLLDLAAGLDPVLEAAEVVDLFVSHILEQLAGKRGARLATRFGEIRGF